MLLLFFFLFLVLNIKQNKTHKRHKGNICSLRKTNNVLKSFYWDQHQILFTGNELISSYPSSHTHCQIHTKDIFDISLQLSPLTPTGATNLTKCSPSSPIGCSHDNEDAHCSPMLGDAFVGACLSSGGPEQPRQVRYSYLGNYNPVPIKNSGRYLILFFLWPGGCWRSRRAIVARKRRLVFGSRKYPPGAHNFRRRNIG